MIDSMNDKAFLVAIDPISKKRKFNELPAKEEEIKIADKVEPPNKFQISNTFKKVELNNSNLVKNFNPPVHKLVTSINIQKNNSFGPNLYKPKDSFLKK